MHGRLQPDRAVGAGVFDDFAHHPLQIVQSPDHARGGPIEAQEVLETAKSTRARGHLDAVALGQLRERGRAYGREAIRF